MKNYKTQSIFEKTTKLPSCELDDDNWLWFIWEEVLIKDGWTLGSTMDTLNGEDNVCTNSKYDSFISLDMIPCFLQKN